MNKHIKEKIRRYLEKCENYECFYEKKVIETYNTNNVNNIISSIDEGYSIIKNENESKSKTFSISGFPSINYIEFMDMSTISITNQVKEEFCSNNYKRTIKKLDNNILYSILNNNKTLNGYDYSIDKCYKQMKLISKNGEVSNEIIYYNIDIFDENKRLLNKYTINDLQLIEEIKKRLVYKDLELKEDIIDSSISYIEISSDVNTFFLEILYGMITINGLTSKDMQFSELFSLKNVSGEECINDYPYYDYKGMKINEYYIIDNGKFNDLHINYQKFKKDRYNCIYTKSNHYIKQICGPADVYNKFCNKSKIVKIIDLNRETFNTNFSNGEVIGEFVVSTQEGQLYRTYLSINLFNIYKSIVCVGEFNSLDNIYPYKSFGPKIIVNKW